MGQRAVSDKSGRITSPNLIINLSELPLDRTFAALGDPTRRAIVSQLAAGAVATSDLAVPFAMSLPAVLKHLRVLEDAGLLHREKIGRTVWCRLRPEAIDAASDWMTETRRFWEQRLDGLAALFDSNAEPETHD